MTDHPHKLTLDGLQTALTRPELLAHVDRLTRAGRHVEARALLARALPRPVQAGDVVRLGEGHVGEVVRVVDDGHRALVRLTVERWVDAHELVAG